MKTALKVGYGIEDLHKRVFTEGPIAVITWGLDASWRCEFASSNVAGVLGVSAARLTSSPGAYRSLLLPEDRERFAAERDQNLREKRRQWNQRYSIMDDAGKTRWILDYTVADYDNGNGLVFLSSYLIDDSAQMAMYQHMQMLSGVFQSIKECLCVTNAAGLILDVNPAFERTTGYSRNEVLGENPRILKSGRHNDNFYRSMWNDLAEKRSWQGEIWNRRKNGEVYPELLSITSVLDRYGNVIRHIGVFTDISNIKQQQQAMERLAHYDILTGLPNRALFTDRLKIALAKARRDKTMLAIAYLDLDGFKPVNDTYGHKAGDRLLYSVARRMTSMLRESDTIARIGGDEFAMVLSGASSHADYLSIIGRFLTQLSTPFLQPEATVSISASIGVTFYPEDDSDPETLLRHADQSMYQAKRDGRARYHAFSPEGPEKEKRAAPSIEDAARVDHALDRGEISLYYLPSVDLRLGKVAGMEAQPHWRHPDLGLLPYAEFMPSLQNPELDIRLGKWVARAAIADLHRWRENNLPLRLTLNVTKNLLLSPTFLAFLDEQLKLYPLVRSNDLEISILAMSGQDEIAAAAPVLEACQRLGVSVVLGDFDTSYSSFVGLRRLPIQRLKLNQGIVRGMLGNPDDLAVVESVISLANAFKYQVVAECPENSASGALLLYMGCDLAQGYGISRPMEAKAIPDWLREWRPDPEWQSIARLKPDHQYLPIFLMRISIQHCCDQVLTYALSSDNERAAPPPLEGFSLFDRWYQTALARHANNSYFPLLKETERHLFSSAQTMLEAVQRARADETAMRVDAFIVARDQFLGIAQRLLQSVTSGER
jgi:diguanylate cyclase (GGDEF)-like protein/PAS domain S-box-containing protein